MIVTSRARFLTLCAMLALLPLSHALADPVIKPAITGLISTGSPSNTLSKLAKPEVMGTFGGIVIQVKWKDIEPNPPATSPSWVPDFDGPWRAGDLSGRPNATKNSRSQFQFLDNDKTLIVSGKMVDIVYKKSNLTTWQPEGQGAKVQDGPLVNLEVGFMRTVHAFRDWTHLLFSHCGYAIYGDVVGLMNAFGEALVRGYSVAFFNHDSADNGQAALSTWLGLIHRLLPEEESAKELAYVKKDPLIKERFYENPELEHLTNIEEWQVLCTLKTLPLTAKLHHEIWMLTRDKIGRAHV